MPPPAWGAKIERNDNFAFEVYEAMNGLFDEAHIPRDVPKE